MSNFFVYIMASKRNGTLYIGLTDDITRRVAEHKNKIFEGFTAKYNVSMLVYFEGHETYDEAYTRERQMKKMEKNLETKLDRKRKP